MNLKTKSIILVTFCFIAILAVSYGFLQFLSCDINAGVATMYAREQINYNDSQLLLALFIALLLLSMTLTFLFNRFVIKRINRLNHHIQSIAQSDKVSFPATNAQDEIGQLETSFQQMAVELQEHTKKLESSVAEQTRELTEKNNQLDSAYRSIQHVEARRRALNEITKDYLTNGDLEQSLELLVANAAKYVGAFAGRFLHCSIEDGKTRVVSVSKMCWPDPSVKIEDLQAQEAFDEYAQSLIQASGDLLDSALKNNQTILLDAKQYLEERSIPLPAGHPEIDSLALTPISIGNKMLGVIALANCPGGFDARDRGGLEAFAAEAALLIHADSREIARSAAEETARLQNTFLTNMRHELRTPLNIIMGMNQLLQEVNQSAKQKDYLQKMDFSARQLLALMTDILDLSKIAAGKELALTEAPFQAVELFYNITQLLAFRQNDRKVELHADISLEIPPYLIGDTLRLSQILNNLLSNALKFTPQGSVTLKVVPLAKTEQQVILGFSIIDTGIGMTAEQMGRVFQPFVQADNSSTREHGGSGLGLAISQQLCQLMGGKLSVESSLGLGSTFHFELPFKIHSTIGQEKTCSPSDPNLQGLSVLVVNSCPACRTILPPMLEAMQLKIDSVTSSSGALMLLSHAIEQGNPYSFVLVGLFLDDMAGVEFMQQLVEDNNPETQKILLANPADVVKLSEQMASLDQVDVVSIPASPSALFKAMTNKPNLSKNSKRSLVIPSTHWQQVRVLLVDDNEMGRKLGKALLENVGIEFYEAKNGLEAIDRVESEDFDLVLMDIQMPVMDGLSATRAIRNLDKKGIENLPIIAMTANSSDENRAESLAAGMNSHITKPIELEVLYAELQRWLPEGKQLSVDKKTISPTDYSALEAALPGVNVKAGIQRVVGNRHLYIDLLKKYIEQYSATEPKLLQELRLKRYDEAILRVHSLKGVAGSLGAKHLQDLAGEVEKQLTQKSKPLALKQMLAEHNKFLGLLENLTELKPSAADNSKSTGSKIELQEILAQMLPPLRSLQAQEVKPLLVKIQGKKWSEEYHEPLLKLEDLVGRYQFNLASELVQNLLNKGEN